MELNQKLICRWARLVILAAVLPCVVVAAEEGATIDRFRIAGDGDALVVPVTVEGKKFNFIVDTGASKTIFNRSLLHSEPIKSEMFVTAGHDIPAELFAVPKASLGSHRLRDELAEVVALDLTNLQAELGIDFDGIIGMDILRSLVMTINFDEHELSLRSKLNRDMPGTSCELSFDEYGKPLLTANFSGHEVAFLIDTGSIDHSSGSLERRYAGYLEKSGDVQLIGSSKYVSASGKHDSQDFRGKFIALGDFRTDAPIVDVGNLNILSLYYFSRFTVTMDFPNRKIYLQKGKGFEKRDEYNRIGMHLIRLKGKITIDCVDSDSTGAKAGVLAGDIISAIDGHSVGNRRLFEVESELWRNVADLPVTLQRGEKQFDVTFNRQSK